MSGLAPRPFEGTARFAVERRLGAGSTGVVYQALDRERDLRVALKTLNETDGEAIYALKREFRSLADLTHPNLAELYELVFDAGRWFIAMELIPGQDFLTHVRGSVERLRTALPQLGAGLAALHGAGKLHRDVKPTNALVTDEGRVVLLDFGLVREVKADHVRETFEPKLVGTPAYLAPEQADGRALTAACDWYSVGVMLFEALTGTLPFDGHLIEVLTRKQQRDAPSPRSLVPDVPEDLDALCTALLQRDPARRPTADEFLRRLGVAAPQAVVAQGSGGAAPWVGRTRELARLSESLARTERGAPVAAFVHGASGMGKTALVQRFLDTVSQREDAVVLVGRCYERELVPYRALDSLVDALARYLMGLPAGEAEALLPRDTVALTRLFPVLRRVEAVANAPRRHAPHTEDPHALRQRGFASLRELLGRLSDRRCVVLFIDDLQWGDVDSAALLRTLLAPPDAPALLLLAAYRSDERESNPCLRELLPRGTDDAATLPIPFEEIEVGPLDDEDARALAAACMDTQPGPAGDAADIAREAGGSPLFLCELVTEARTDRAPEQTTLDEVLVRRIQTLGDDARRLLTALAISGRPLERAIALRVAALPRGDRHAIGALRAGRMARLLGATSPLLDVYHDRIRQAVLTTLDAEALRAQHAAMAAVLAQVADVEPETLSVHLEGAGDKRTAAHHAARAALRAEEALAFERAVGLYRRALALGDAAAPEAGGWRERLGDALANLGRGAEAAAAYLDAARTATAEPALELRRRAAEQLLRVGQLGDGLEAMRVVLKDVGEDLAETPRKALVALLGQRARLRLRGLRFKARGGKPLTSVERTRIDVYWSVATALGIIDNVRATEFQARHLLLALKLGEPLRLVRALAAEASYSAVDGEKARRRTERLLRMAEDVAKGVDQPFARGWSALAAGIAAYLQGRHRSALTLCEQAEGVFSGCVGVWWEVGSARLFSLWSLYYLGELAELSRRVPLYLEDAEARGDLYNATNLRLSILTSHWLRADDPARARREMERAMRAWSWGGFHSQHYWHMIGEATVALYEGQPEAAWARMNVDWQRLRDSMLLRVQTARIEAFDLRGRVALAMAARATSGRARDEALASVLRNVSRLEREQARWAAPFARVLRAGLAAVSGDRPAAAREITDAAAGFEAAEMALHASAALRRAGALRGGPAGQNLIREADQRMSAQGIQSPAAMTALLIPGLD